MSDRVMTALVGGKTNALESANAEAKRVNKGNFMVNEMFDATNQ
jgi:hypothetical protein